MNKFISQPKTDSLRFFLNWCGLLWVILVFTLAFISPVYARSNANPTSTHRIKVHLSPYRLNPATGNWETTATLINRSRQAFYTPIFLEISQIEYQNKHDEHEHEYDEHEEREHGKHGHGGYRHEHTSISLVNADGKSPKGES